MKTKFHEHLKAIKFTVSKKLFLAFLAMLSLTTTVIASDGSKNVNYWVLNKFNATYQEAKDVNWIVTDKFAKASFLMEGEKMEVYYSPEGEFIAESKAIPTGELPRAARKALDKKYKNFTIKEVIEYSTTDRVEYYVSLENDKSTKILKISNSGSIEVYKSFDK
jgi:hypothetical protein